jgi:hypothetical protein
MFVYYVDFEDCSSVWSSYYKAMDYARGEISRIGGKIYSTELLNGGTILHCTSRNDEEFEISINEYEVGTKPYLD